MARLAGYPEEEAAGSKSFGSSLLSKSDEGSGSLLGRGSSSLLRQEGESCSRSTFGSGRGLMFVCDASSPAPVHEKAELPALAAHVPPWSTPLGGGGAATEAESGGKGGSVSRKLDARGSSSLAPQPDARAATRGGPAAGARTDARAEATDGGDGAAEAQRSPARTARRQPHFDGLPMRRTTSCEGQGRPSRKSTSREGGSAGWSHSGEISGDLGSSSLRRSVSLDSSARETMSYALETMLGGLEVCTPPRLVTHHAPSTHAPLMHTRVCSACLLLMISSFLL